MNFLNVIIFITFTFFLTSGAFYIPFKHKSYDIWKEKNPTSSKIKKLAKESVNYYNREHGTKYFLDCVLRAGKEYVNGLAHYFLKILGIENCGHDGEVCSEIFYSNVYDNGKRLNHKYNFSVDTKGSAPSF
uniref:Cystatin domain-containing protein n=1 Tax=Strongyloides papillosus TaxID=174720 RepID=A0A0N5BQC3_STREA